MIKEKKPVQNCICGQKTVNAKSMLVSNNKHILSHQGKNIRKILFSSKRRFEKSLQTHFKKWK